MFSTLLPVTLLLLFALPFLVSGVCNNPSYVSTTNSGPVPVLNSTATGFSANADSTADINSRNFTIVMSWDYTVSTPFS